MSTYSNPLTEYSMQWEFGSDQESATGAQALGLELGRTELAMALMVCINMRSSCQYDRFSSSRHGWVPGSYSFRTTCSGILAGAYGPFEGSDIP
jgi:hypothetical protein